MIALFLAEAHKRIWTGSGTGTVTVRLIWWPIATLMYSLIKTAMAMHRSVSLIRYNTTTLWAAICWVYMLRVCICLFTFNLFPRGWVSMTPITFHFPNALKWEESPCYLQYITNFSACLELSINKEMGVWYHASPKQSCFWPISFLCLWCACVERL